jgi:hypothetical protein
MQKNILARARSKLAVFLGALALAALALPMEAQFSINWHKISGGGGTSTSSHFALSGTVGQQDAGPAMTSANYSLTGGFWALYALQTTGAPTLGISFSSNIVTVYWPSPSTGWNLQVNTDLSTTNWGAPPQTVNDNGTIKYILVTPPTGNRYYRLMK